MTAAAPFPAVLRFLWTLALAAAAIATSSTQRLTPSAEDARGGSNARRLYLADEELSPSFSGGILTSISSTETSRSLRYYDDLRRGGAEETMARNVVAGSNVVRVFVPDDPPSRSRGGCASNATFSTTTTTGTNHSLCNLAALLALTSGGDGDGGSQRAQGLDEVAAVLLAAHHFNNRLSSVVPDLAALRDEEGDRHGRQKMCDIRLTVDHYDTRHDPLEAVRIFLSDDVRGIVGPGRGEARHLPGPCGVVGPWRSVSAVPLSSFAASIGEGGDRGGGDDSDDATGFGAGGVPIVSHGAMSSDLDNKDQHPLFGRTIVSTSGVAQAAVQYFRLHLNIRHVAVLHVDDAYGLAYRRSFEESATEMGLTVRSYALFRDGRLDARRARTILKRVREKTGYRYVFCIFYSMSHHFEIVLREAARLGMAGRESGTHWTFAELDHVEASRKMAGLPETDPLSRVTSFATFKTTGGVPGDVGKPSSYDRFLQEWADARSSSEFAAYVKEKIPKSLSSFPGMNWTLPFEKVPSSWTFFAFDAVIAYGLAACNASASTSNKEGFFSGPELYNSFLNTNFNGSSGPVMIDKVTGSRDHASAIFTINNAVMHQSNMSGNTSLVIHPSLVYVGGQWKRRHDGRAFVYGDGTTDPPDPLPPPLDHNCNFIGNVELITGYTLCALVVATAICCWRWTWTHRSTSVVVAAQPVFLYMILFGIFVMASTILPLSMHEHTCSIDLITASSKSLDMSCMSIPWLAECGFCVVFSALFDKTLRINKVMHQRNFRRVTVGVKDVIKPAVMLISSNVIVLTVWTLVAPLKWKRIPGEATDQYGRPLTSYGKCALPDQEEDGVPNWLSTLIVVLSVSVNGAAMAIAVFQAYQARDIESQYSESKYIALSIFGMLQAWLMGIPLYFVVRDTPSARFVVASTVLFVTCEAILLFIFVPKLSKYNTWREAQTRREQERIRKMKAPTWLSRKVRRSARSRRQTEPTKYATQHEPEPPEEPFPDEPDDSVSSDLDPYTERAQFPSEYSC